MAVPEESTQEPLPLQARAAVEQSGRQEPSESLSWYPESQTQAALPEASSQEALAVQVGEAVEQSGRQEPSESLS